MSSTATLVPFKRTSDITRSNCFKLLQRVRLTEKGTLEMIQAEKVTGLVIKLGTPVQAQTAVGQTTDEIISSLLADIETGTYGLFNLVSLISCVESTKELSDITHGMCFKLPQELRLAGKGTLELTSSKTVKIDVSMHRLARDAKKCEDMANGTIPATYRYRLAMQEKEIRKKAQHKKDHSSPAAVQARNEARGFFEKMALLIFTVVFDEIKEMLHPRDRSV
jgi:hypothetical protein